MKNVSNLTRHKKDKAMNKNASYMTRLKKDMSMNKYVYIMILPVVAYYLIFKYKPMYGAIIAFMDYNPVRGIWQSEWVGLDNFKDFITGFFFWRVLRNTLLINFYQMLTTILPIIFALLLNELTRKRFKRSIQTITYLPHFISAVIVCGMVIDFCNTEGLINDIVSLFGGNRAPFLQNPKYFRTIYISMGIWQNLGWSTIIYLAALTSIDPQQYESAIIDGASRFKRAIYITIPGLIPTIVIIFIMQMGRFLSEGAEKVLLLYNPITYETADIISTYVFRMGLEKANWSLSTAVDLLNSVVNFAMLIMANKLSRKVTQNSLW